MARVRVLDRIRVNGKGGWMGLGRSLESEERVWEVHRHILHTLFHVCDTGSPGTADLGVFPTLGSVLRRCVKEKRTYNEDCSETSVGNGV